MSAVRLISSVALLSSALLCACGDDASSVAADLAAAARDLTVTTSDLGAAGDSSARDLLAPTSCPLSRLARRGVGR